MATCRNNEFEEYTLWQLQEIHSRVMAFEIIFHQLLVKSPTHVKHFFWFLRKV